jgi:Squalene-hopene cyclase N-terminal domain
LEDRDGLTECCHGRLELAVHADPERAQIEVAISRATQALLTAQREDGHFVFELEADVSIPAEYILFKHYLFRAEGGWR